MKLLLMLLTSAYFSSAMTAKEACADVSSQVTFKNYNMISTGRASITSTFTSQGKITEIKFKIGSDREKSRFFSELTEKFVCQLTSKGDQSVQIKTGTFMIDIVISGESAGALIANNDIAPGLAPGRDLYSTLLLQLGKPFEVREEDKAFTLIFKE